MRAALRLCIGGLPRGIRSWPVPAPAMHVTIWHSRVRETFLCTSLAASPHTILARCRTRNTVVCACPRTALNLLPAPTNCWNLVRRACSCDCSRGCSMRSTLCTSAWHHRSSDALWGCGLSRRRRLRSCLFNGSPGMLLLMLLHSYRADHVLGDHLHCMTLGMR